MDPSFFGLGGHPFDMSSDEAFLAEPHGSLITELRAGLKAPHGITLLIGEEDTGKTRLARHFADLVADNGAVAYLPTPGPGLRHLLTEAIEQLGGTAEASADESALLERLRELALARAEHDRKTLLVVDDAHELPAKTIERLGRLFGDDPADPSLLHVILVGRPDLLDRMNAANDRTILKHLVQVCRMDPIGPEESFRYIAERVAKVGGTVERIFTEDALRLIVKRAGGSPRRLNEICSAALERAAETGEKSVAREIADLACRDENRITLVAGHDATDGANGMDYIFGDEEAAKPEPNRLSQREHEEAHEPTIPTTPARPGSKMRMMSNPARSANGSGPTGDIARALIERVSLLADGRRRMALWAVGLLAVLVGFASMMTQTSEDRSAVADELGERTALDRPAAARPLPANALPAERLIVTREPPPAAAKPSPPEATPSRRVSPIAPPTRPSAAVTAPAAAATKTGPAEAPGRPRVQAPAYEASTGDAAPAPAAAPAPKPEAPAEVAARPSQVEPEPAKAEGAAVSTPAANGGQASAKPAPAPTATASKPAPKVTARAQQQPKPAAARAAVAPIVERYTVQVGAFKSRGNAEILLAKVVQRYPDARIIASKAGEATVFRVVSGAFTTKGDATGRASVLAANGFTTFVRTMP